MELLRISHLRVGFGGGMRRCVNVVPLALDGGQGGKIAMKTAIYSELLELRELLLVVLDHGSCTREVY